MTNYSDTPDTENTSNEGSHLKSYIEYYKKLENPGYGVLVTGNWGSGKTHQIQEILAQEEYHYISLFGAQTTDEVYSSVYAKMFPAKSKSKEIASSANGIGIGPLTLGNLVSGIANAILRDEVDPGKILVFDDLERSKIQTNDLLGVFNKYIEHHKCRVIVLAHDKQVSTTLKQIKEKVFGQTIEVFPQTSKAFDSFIENIKDIEAKSLLVSMKEIILKIFDQSETHSLRILKHSIEDLSRLFGTLLPEHTQNATAMTDLTKFFLTLSLEVRSGRIDEEDLKDRSSKIMSHNFKKARESNQVVAPAISIANSRYGSIDLGSLLLKDETLINLLIKGNYSPSDVHDSLNETLYFSNPDDLAPWLVFLNFDDISDNESQAAAEKLKDQFSSRSVTEPGELLHLFALRFLFSNMELITEDFNQTELDCKKYLDDLLSRNTIEPYIGHESSWGNDFTHAYKGFGYWVEPAYKESFERIIEYLKDTQHKAAQSQYPEHTKRLLKLMVTDGTAFAREISLTFSGGNTFANVPILASIDPIEFVQEWMGSPAINWQKISRGLESRYRGGELFSTLSAEKIWLKRVIEAIDIEHKKARQIRKKRIQRIISDNLRSAAYQV